MRANILIILFCLLANLGISQSSLFENLAGKDLSSILDRSRQDNKHLLIYFTTQGCAPCERMQKDVFPDFELRAFLTHNFICVKTSAAKGDQQDAELRDRLGIRGNPNFVIVDKDLNIVHRLPRSAMGSGYKSKEELIQFGKEAIENKVSFATYQKKYESGDYSFETVSGFLNLLTPVAMKVVDGEYENYTQDVLDNYFVTQSDEDFTSSDNWYLIKNFVDNASSEPFKYLLKNSEKFYAKYGKEEVDDRIDKVLTWYGDYGNVQRIKVARQEMAQWGIPKVDEFLSQLD